MVARNWLCAAYVVGVYQFCLIFAALVNITNLADIGRSSLTPVEWGHLRVATVSRRPLSSTAAPEAPAKWGSQPERGYHKGAVLVGSNRACAAPRHL
jgi:hypothetical protein